MISYTVHLLERSGVPHEYIIHSEKELPNCELISIARKEVSEIITCNPMRLHYVRIESQVLEEVLS